MRIFSYLFLLLIPLISLEGFAAVEDEEDIVEQEQVIRPDVYRRDIIVPKIDTEDFEIIAFVGILDVESFGSDTVIGGRFAYHVTEDFFVEASYAKSEVDGKNFELLNNVVLFGNRNGNKADIDYYSGSLGYNILPGEVFIGENIAMSSSFYLIAGIGNLDFGGEDEFIYHAGLGLRVLPTDWLSLRIDIRDYIFETDVLGENEFTHNIEATFNVGIFF